MASNYEARLDGVRPATADVHAAALGGDIKLSLSVDPGHVVIVLGVVGEPFLRYAGGAVYANAHSPTAAEIRLVHLRPGASQRPQWLVVHHGRTFAWHESRLRPVSSHRTGRIAAISIPLRIDGRPARVVGASWHATGPPLWPWVVIGLLPVIALAMATRFRPGRVGLITAILATIAIAVTVASVAGRTLQPPYGTAGAAVQIGAAGVLGAVAIVMLIRARAVNRGLVAASIGVVVSLYTAASLSVIVDGFVLSRLPADVDRASTVLGFAIGICLVGVEVMSWMRRTRPISTGPIARKRAS